MSLRLSLLVSSLGCLVLSAALTACQPQEQTLLLDVTAQRELSEVSLRVVSLDVPRAPYEDTRRLPTPRTPAELRANPARIAVVLDAPAQILVHLVGRGTGGETLVATRCYTLNGVIEDDVLLVGPLGALDADGDSFVVDPAVACREPTDDGGDRVCDELDYLCPDGRASDCDDATATIYPGAPPICQNGVDEDCDGMDEPCGDQDGDGFDACAETATPGCDCDDTNPQINPGAVESPGDADVCLDGLDQNCDGEDVCCDLDGDGYTRCGRERPNEEDCVDTQEQCPAGTTCAPADINPSATEVPAAGEMCDQIDNDCNGFVDDSDACRGPDFDGDGSPHCGLPGVDPPCDCNDCDSGVGPTAREICGNGVDEDCSGDDEPCAPGDTDQDGQLPPGDCNDDDRFAHTHAAGEPVFDLCADTIAATCVPGEHRTCAEDADGDGYVEPAGCEDDPTVGPLIAEVCNGADDNCDGSIDEVRDPSGMSGCAQAMPLAFFADDRTNCGGCRVECPTGVTDVCQDGACDCSTDPGRGVACSDDPIAGGAATVPQCCGDGCVDLDDDPNNCGGCGRACGQGEICAGGLCTCGATQGAAVGDHACPDGGDESSVCCGSGASAACRDVTADGANCGQCGLACGAHSTCQDRFCTCDPVGGGQDWRDCNGDRFSLGNDGCEIDVRSNDSHCGTCNNQCNLFQANDTCTAGVCRITMCLGTFQNCDTLDGTGCEANLTQAATCGACGARCGSGESCSSMACTCGPDAGAVAGGEVCLGSEPDCCPSAGGCTNLANQTNNCGACGATCGPGETCSTRACHCGPVDGTQGGGRACTGSNNRCCPGSGNCVNTNTSTTNCGGCGVTCGTNEVCQSPGQCDCGPTTGATGAGAACTGSNPNCCGAAGCVNFNTDEARCGSCTASCGPGETCASPGQCTCGSDVGGTAGGRVCTAQQTCCATGDGCVNFDTDESNCGGCGVSCGAAETCGAGGVCACGPDSGTAGSGGVCVSGETCCPGATAADGCVDTMTDELNCGGCDVVCGANEMCVGGVCRCGSVPASGSGPACTGLSPNCCPSVGCVDFQNDPAHCGSCTATCGAAPELCSSGRCTCGATQGSVGGGAACASGQLCCDETPDVCRASCM